MTSQSTKYGKTTFFALTNRNKILKMHALQLPKENLMMFRQREHDFKIKFELL